MMTRKYMRIIRTLLFVCTIVPGLPDHGYRVHAQPASTGVPAPAPGNPAPDARFKADVLLVLAHPDDETAIGSRLVEMIFDQGRKIAAVYTKRGNGGGNSVGNEQSIAMGLVRETEARQDSSHAGFSRRGDPVPV